MSSHFFKRLFPLLLAVIWLPQTVYSQKRRLNLEMGVNVQKPYLSTQKEFTSKWNHSFWMGFQYLIHRPGGSTYVGLSYYGSNYKLEQRDSGDTYFMNLHTFGLPIQFSVNGKSGSWGFLGGMEPKLVVGGKEYINTPSVSSRIEPGAADGVYNFFLFALRAGIQYQKGAVRYFLQYSADLIPMKNLPGGGVYDSKITFGFTMLTLWKK